MSRTKTRNKGRLKSFHERDLVHYKRYNNNVISLLDDTNEELLGFDVVDNIVDIPPATLNDKKIIRCLELGLGGTTLISLNDRWRCLYGSTALKCDYNSVSLAAPKTTKQILRQVTIPMVDGKSLMQPGDMIRLYNDALKTGSANIFSRSFFFGGTATTSDTEIDLTAASSANININNEIAEFYRMSDSGGSSVIMKNFSKGFLAVGLGGTQGATVLEGESITIANMDTNTTIMSLAYVLNGTSDTLAHLNWNVELITCGG